LAVSIIIFMAMRRFTASCEIEEEVSYAYTKARWVRGEGGRTMKTSCENRDERSATMKGRRVKKATTYKLVETPDRTSHRLPHRQQQTDRRERLLSTGQALRVLLLTTLLLLMIFGLDGDEELARVVVELKLAGKVAVVEVSEELGASAVADVVTEVSPAGDTSLVIGRESLREEATVSVAKSKMRRKEVKRTLTRPASSFVSLMANAATFLRRSSSSMICTTVAP
jgi:hypothetical protein